MFTLFLIIATLQNPSPSRAIVSQNQQHNTRNAQQKTADDQRGTEDSPFVVKVLPTPKTQEEETQEAQDRAEKASNDRKLVAFTGKLVIATYILAAIALFQACVFIWQGIQLKRTVAATQANADAIISGQRAWMTVRLKPVTGFDFELQVANFGQTPGIVAGYQFARTGMPILTEPIPELEFWGTPNDRRLMLTREDSFMRLDNFMIWDYLEPWVEHIQTGKQVGIFAVKVSYTDIFRRNDLHETLMVYSTKDGHTLTNMPKHNRYS
jgi:hypothetical protein